MQSKPLHNDYNTARCEKLYHIFHKTMLKMAGRILGDVYLAEDAVQQTFERLLSYHESFDKVRAGCEWCYMKTVLVRVCIDLLRELEQLIPVDEPKPQTSLGYLSYHISAEDEVFKAYGLQSEIRGLPEKYAVVMDLHFLQDYSYEEIGRICCLKPATVRKRVQRGRAMLIVKMKNDE